MGKKKQDKKLRKRFEGLVADAESAAERAEKAAQKAKKQRKRAEDLVSSAGQQEPQQPLALEAPAAPSEATEPEADAPPPTPAPTPAPAADPGDPTSTGPQVPAGQLGASTRAQLVDLARSAGIPGRTRMSKEELLQALGGGR